MGKVKVGSRPNEFKYGMALYGAAWPPGDHFFVCGGGGHGLVNRIVWARFQNGRCSDQVGEYKLGSATPMRMALAPSGSALLLGMSDGGVRRFQLDLTGPSPRVIEVSAAFAERFEALRDEVTCMAFSGDGRLMAVGFANGRIKLVAYPTMKALAEWKLEAGVRDLDFAWHTGGGPQQGPVLASTCENGTCQLWDVVTCQPMCQLQLPRGMEKAQISRCRFSRSAPVLFVVLNQARGSCQVAAYGPDADTQRRATAPPAGPPAGAPTGAGAASWVLLKRHEVDSGPNAAMEISRTGRFLALGQAEGGLLVVDTRTLSVVASEPQASMVFVTRVAFADDDSRVMAVGADANAFVLELKGRGGGGGGGGGCGFCTLLLLLFLAAAAAIAYLGHTQPERLQEAVRLLEEFSSDPRVAAHIATARAHLVTARAHVETGVTVVQAKVQQLMAKDEL